MTLVVQLRVAACGATTEGRAWRRRAHLCDLAWLAERLVGHEERPIRELARTLASEARRASMTRARWLAIAAQAFGLELAAMIEEGPAAAAARRPVGGSFRLGVHYCHVPGCKCPTPASRLMCGRHWRRVPPALRRAVLRAYRAGQEVDKSPSPAWLDAAKAAIEAVQPKRFGLPHPKPPQEP